MARLARFAILLRLPLLPAHPLAQPGGRVLAEVRRRYWCQVPRGSTRQERRDLAGVGLAVAAPAPG